MRRSLASAAVAAGLLVLAGGSRKTDTGDTGPATADSNGDSGADHRNRVLVYTGHGGVDAAGIDGSMTHADSTAALLDAGLEVDHTDQWPSSLDPYRLVILPAPGARDANAVFTPVELADLIGVMNAGGVVVVEAEPGTVLNDEVLNEVVWDLNGSMYTTGEGVDGPATPWGDHPLTQGVATVGLAAAAAVERGDDTCLLDTPTRCVAAAAATGEGWLVLLGDGNLLSEAARFDAEGYDNLALLYNLAGIL